jgi:hypothetical protein
MMLQSADEAVSLAEVLRAFFSWSDSALLVVVGAANWQQVVLWIVLLAGLSEAVGQSVVLFANRVKPLRFMLSLGVTALLFSVGFLIWVVSIRVLVSFVLGSDIAWRPLLIITGVSYIPLLFSFLGLLPYAGQPILQGLYVWSFLLMVSYVRQAEGLTTVEALWVTGVGIVLILLLRSLAGRPLNALARHILDQAAGAPLTYDVELAVARLAGELPNDATPEERRFLDRLVEQAA